MPLIPATILAQVEAEARRQGVDPALARGVAQAESGGNPLATSPKGARGVMQLMPGTAERYGVSDAYDPGENIRGGVAYLKDLGTLFPGNVAHQIAAYNAGEGAVQAYHGIPPYRETRTYVQRVLQYMGLTPGSAEAAERDPGMEADLARAQHQDDLSGAVVQQYQQRQDTAMEADIARAQGPAPVPAAVDAAMQADLAQAQASTPATERAPAAPMDTELQQAASTPLAAATPVPAAAAAATVPRHWLMPEGSTLGQAVGQTALQVVGGARDAFVHTMQSLNLLGDWMRAHGIGPGETLTIPVPEVPHTNTTAGDIIRGATQFLSVFVPVAGELRAVGLAGHVAQGLTAGALTDFAAFGAQEPRLSDALNQLPAPLKNPVTTYLAHQPGDTEATGRLKRSLEGLGLGVLTMGLLHAVESLWGLRAARQAATTEIQQVAGQQGVALTEPEIDAAMQAEMAAAQARKAADLTQAQQTLAAIQAGDAEVTRAQLTRAQAVIAGDGTVVLGRGQQPLRFTSEQEAATHLLTQRVARITEQEYYTPLNALRRAMQDREPAPNLVGSTDVGLQGQQLQPLTPAAPEVPVEGGASAVPGVPPDVAPPGLIARRLAPAPEPPAPLPPPVSPSFPTDIHLSGDQIQGLLSRAEATPAAPAMGSASQGLPAVPEVGVPRRLARALEPEPLPTSQPLPQGALRQLVDARTPDPLPTFHALPAAQLRQLLQDRAPIPLSPFVTLEVAPTGVLPEAASLAAAGAEAATPTGRYLHINFGQIATADDVRSTLATVAEMTRLQADTQRRGTQTIADMVAASQQSRYRRLADILQIQPGTVLKAEDTYAVMQTWITSATRLAELQQRLLAGEDVADDYLKQWILTANISPIAQGVLSEPGRTLRMLGEEIPATTREFLNAFTQKIATSQDAIAPIRPPALPTAAEAPGGLRPGQLAPLPTPPDVGLPTPLRLDLPPGERPGVPVGAPTATAVPVQDALEKALRVRVAQKLAGHLDMLTEDQMARFLREAQQTNQPGLFNEILYGSLFSFPATWVGNGLDGAYRTLWAVPERYMAAGMGDIALQEGNQLLYGMAQGLKESWQYAARAMETGTSAFGAGGKVPVARLPAFTSANLGLPQDIASQTLGQHILADYVDALGAVLRFGPRVLLATDEFFHALNFRMQLHALAFREAAQSGKRGPDLRQAISTLLDSPSESMLAGARAFSDEQTLRQPLDEGGFVLLSGLTAKLGALTQEHPVAKLLFPVLNAPFNAFRQFGERTPLGLTSPTILKQLFTREGPEAALARAKFGLGAMALLTFGILAQEGILRGKAPEGQQATWARLGIQENSLNLGGHSLSYNRLDFIGMPMGLAADLVTVLNHVPTSTATELAGGIIAAFWDNAMSRQWLQSTADVVDAISGGVGETQKETGDDAARWLRQRIPSLFVPSAVGQMARAIDPAQHEVRNLLDAFLVRIPGLSEGVPVAKDRWGQPREHPTPWGMQVLSPILSQEHTPNAVDLELERLGVVVPQVPRTINLPHADRTHPWPVELSPEQYGRLQELSAGIGLKGVDRPLREELARLIALPGYQDPRLSDGPSGGRATLLKAVIQHYDAAGIAQLQAEDPQVRALMTARDIASQAVQLRQTPAPLQQVYERLGIGR